MKNIAGLPLCSTTYTYCTCAARMHQAAECHTTRPFHKGDRRGIGKAQIRDVFAAVSSPPEVLDSLFLNNESGILRVWQIMKKGFRFLLVWIENAVLYSESNRQHQHG